VTCNRKKREQPFLAVAPGGKRQRPLLEKEVLTGPTGRGAERNLCRVKKTLQFASHGCGASKTVVLFSGSSALRAAGISRRLVFGRCPILLEGEEFAFIDLSEQWSTGSSIMPQKKNPDFAELIRGRTGKVYGDLMALLVMVKGLPLAYDRDLQEDKASLFDALDTCSTCLTVFTAMISSAKWNEAKMAASCEGGFANATDVAEYLVRKGMPFRTAHGVAAKAVRLAIDAGLSRIEDLSIEELKKCSELIDEDLYDKIAPRSCMEARRTAGGPSPECVKAQLKALKKFCIKNKK